METGTGWFLRDVWFALHLAAIIGCAIYVFAWYIGFPTDTWGALEAGWEVVVGLIPGIVLGLGLPVHYYFWRSRRSERSNQLTEGIQALNLLAEDWLKQAGLNELSLENLLGESGKIDEVSDDPANLEQDDQRHVYREKRLNSLLHN